MNSTPRPGIKKSNQIWNIFFQIIRLEAERTQWEQRYFEESAMRQVAIDAASIPKDAKIAALVSLFFCSSMF